MPLFSVTSLAFGPAVCKEKRESWKVRSFPARLSSAAFRTAKDGLSEMRDALKFYLRMFRSQVAKMRSWDKLYWKTVKYTNGGGDKAYIIIKWGIKEWRDIKHVEKTEEKNEKTRKFRINLISEQKKKYKRNILHFCQN
jgi:hypothetical protein